MDAISAPASCTLSWRKRQAERRQVIAAIGPLWSWHEVWLVAFGGVVFVAFPRLLGVAFSGYYLALFLVLWCLILRGISLEVGGHINDPMWQSFWDFVFPVANVLLGFLFGTALGNVVRGVPLEESGEFHMAFFTDFGVRGNVGLLDWFSVSMGVVCLVMATAHGATYLTFKTEGPVHDRCEAIARKLWAVIPGFFILITVQTWYVRPELFGGMARNPIAWLAVLVSLAGAFSVFTGLRQRLELRTFLGSCMIVFGLLSAGAAAMFPVILHSTLAIGEFAHRVQQCGGRKEPEGGHHLVAIRARIVLRLLLVRSSPFRREGQGCRKSAGTLLAFTGKLSYA